MKIEKGKLIILPPKKESKVLLYDKKGEPLIIEQSRTIGFRMEKS